MTEPACSALAAEHGEDLHATASIVRAWLLVEQGGAWGPDAITQSHLPQEIAVALAAMARAARVRMVLLRRPQGAGAVSSRSGPRRCFLAFSGRGSPWIREAVVDDLESMLEVDLGSVGRGEPPAFGEVHSSPLYLVCTHGRHDQCCANLGRPVVRALSARRSDGVWECSHIGGDRFAGNLVCLPHGLYFGRLGPEDTTRVVESYEAGRIELDHYRGRAGDPFPVQAAEFFLRRERGLDGIDDVSPVGRRRVEPGVDEVTFAEAGGTRWVVRIGAAPAGEPRLLTCRATVPVNPMSFRLLEIGGA